MRRFAIVFAALTVTHEALALDDCPPGSVSKSEDGFTWCEPSLCLNDGQCRPTEVCRPVALCMEIGTLNANAKADAGKRLVVTQRCGPDKTCPQNQTCSDLKRCIDKTAADKMGLLAAPSATPAEAPEAKKKSGCGCDVVSARGGALPWAIAPLALGLILRVRARRRGSRPQPR